MKFYRHARVEVICIVGLNQKHPKANAMGLYPLHRVIMENKIGRNLTDDEVVHHIDEIKSNNEEDNLELLSRVAHAKKHRLKIPLLDLVCPICGESFNLEPAQYRLRLKRNKSGVVFCSRRCGSTM